MSKAEILSESEVAEIEKHYEISIDSMFARSNIPALCHTVRALRAETESWKKLREDRGDAESVRNFALLIEGDALKARLNELQKTIGYWQNHVKRMGNLLECPAIDGDIELAVVRLQSENAALREGLAQANASRRVHELDNHHNAIDTKGEG